MGPSVDPRIQVLANVSETRDLEGGLTGETVSEKKPETYGKQEKDEGSAPARITFAPDPRHTVNEKGTLRIAGPREAACGSYNTAPEFNCTANDTIGQNTDALSDGKRA